MTTFKYSHLFTMVALFVFLHLSLSVQADEPSCADYLELTNSKPAHLTFRSCEKGKNAQLSVLIATYTVAGLYADEVESDLVKRFKMPSPRFVCCGWETLGGYGSFVYEGYDVAIRMTSEETILRNREDWPKISKFFVTATLYLEEP